MLNKLGVFLKKLRIDNNHVLKDMADILGVSSSFLSAIENGKKKIPEAMVIKIKKYYKLSFEQIMEFEESIIEANSTIEFNIDDLNEKQKEMAISLYRKIKKIDNSKIDKILEIIDEKDR